MFKKEKKRLGEILLEAGLINQKQLQIALDRQKTSGERLGLALVNENIVTEQQILDILEHQLGISKVNLNHQYIPAEVIRLIPESLAKRHNVIGVAIRNSRLSLAMSDPMNVHAIDDVRMVTGKDVEPVLAPYADIEKAIKQHYEMSQSVNQALKDITNQTLGMETASTINFNISDLENMTDDAPVVRIVNSVIQQAVKQRASDIHIEPLEKSLRIRFRIDGVLQEVMHPPKNSQAAIVSRIKIMANLDISEHRLPQDGRLEVRVGNDEVDLRVSILPTIFGEKVVIRILNKSNIIYDLDQLGFQPDLKKQVEKLINNPNGIIMVTGPTGSGKTTTLYAMLSRLNKPNVNIITIEDPVEYRIDGINQVQVSNKVGITFASGLRSILRQDPNIIMVGEIRDKETAEISIRAALTGHLVLSTLHTNDAAGTLVRLIDMEIEPFLVTSSIVGIIAQRLVRKICPYCKESYEVPTDAQERKITNTPPEQPFHLFRGLGCARCNNTGYLGRAPIYEILILNQEIRDLANKKSASDIIKEAAKRNGMKTLFQDGVLKVLNGETTLQEVMKVALFD